jgi:hypothetical protein
LSQRVRCEGPFPSPPTPFAEHRLGAPHCHDSSARWTHAERGTGGLRRHGDGSAAPVPPKVTSPPPAMPSSLECYRSAGGPVAPLRDAREGVRGGGIRHPRATAGDATALGICSQPLGPSMGRGCAATGRRPTPATCLAWRGHGPPHQAALGVFCPQTKNHATPPSTSQRRKGDR